jgi:hypothetical protein
MAMTTSSSMSVNPRLNSRRDMTQTLPTDQTTMNRCGNEPQ